jgi:hypothetical protein
MVDEGICRKKHIKYVIKTYIRIYLVIARKSKAQIYLKLTSKLYYFDLRKLKYFVMKYSNGQNESVISKNLSGSQGITT